MAIQANVGRSIRKALYALVIGGHAGLIAVRMRGEGTRGVTIRAYNRGCAGVACMAIVARRVRQIAIVGSAVDREVVGIVRRVSSAGPIHEGVAVVTGVCETDETMRRITGASVVGLVAAPTIGRGRGVVAVMTIIASIVVIQRC